MVVETEIIGVIDIGTYSTRILIVEINKKETVKESIKSIKEVFSTGKITALGRNVKKNRYLEKEAVEETLKVLKEYVDISKKYNVSKLFGYATEACRIAINGGEFLKKVKNLGIEVQVIDGEREAYLSFIASAYSLDLKDNFLVIDEGGGSTEFALGSFENDKAYLKRAISKPFGIVNLTERFIHNDPIGKKDLELLDKYLQEEVNNIYPYLKDTEVLVGLGGTITTLVALEKNIYPYDPLKIHGVSLSYEVIKKWFEKLSSISVSERKKFPQIEDRRAKVLPVGIYIFIVIMDIFKKDYIIVSDKGLRYGAVIDYVLKSFEDSK